MPEQRRALLRLLACKKYMSEQQQERVHHQYSPSSLESLEACPCFVNRQSDTPHERTIAGTKAHAVADSRKDDSSLSDEDAEAVAVCLDLVGRRKQLMEEARDRQLVSASPEDRSEISEVLEIKEDYWPVDDLVFPDAVSTTAGYADVVLISHDRARAEIIDHKFGKWAVTEAKTNLQGIAYSLGVFKRFPSVQEIQVWFVQPLLDYTTEATFKRSEIPELMLRVSLAVARAREARRTGDFQTAKPAVPLCQFCGNLGKCPAVAKFACQVGQKFYPLAFDGEDLTPSAIYDPKRTTLGLQLAAVLRVWCEAFRQQVTDRVISGRAEMPAGFKLESRAEREVLDMEKLKQVVLTYLTKEEFDTTLSTTFGSIEKLISEKAPRGSKKSTLEDLKTKLEQSGAVKRGDPYHFLKAVPKDK